MYRNLEIRIIPFIFLLINLSLATIINVPGTQPTIQDGIYTATTGDTVLVADGSYTENINFLGKAIVVASHFLVDGNTAHISNTIIDGSQPTYPTEGAVVTFDSNEDTSSVLCGFTITGGTGKELTDHRAGGGIYIRTAGAIVIHNKIISNQVSSTGFKTAVGGGIIGYDLNSPLIIKSNTIIDNNVSGFYAFGGGIITIGEQYIEIVNNKIVNNHAYTTSNIPEYSSGGGIDVEHCNPEIRNNLVAQNSSGYGGGIDVFFPLENANSPTSFFSVSRQNAASTIKSLLSPNESNPTMNPETVNRIKIINNTVADNTADRQGGGICSFTAIPMFINNIVWGNQAPSGPQIYGLLSADYCDIQGGFPGNFNLDLDPLFIDNIHYYLNDPSSPCIDAGNPNSIFNDLEDPMAPGNALWPALGGLRNDMGAYGGNPAVPVDSVINAGPMFLAFLDRIQLVPSGQRQAIADSFLATINSFPFIEDSIYAVFLYTGNPSSVNVPGDFNFWETTAFSMSKITGTNLWYYPAVFEPDARLDYKFVLFGNSWILDPRNPRTCTGGYGPNSELSMPAYVQPPEIGYNPGMPHGELDTLLNFSSTILGNNRHIYIYKPHSYSPTGNDSFPVVLFHDGKDFIDLAYANNVLDYLIAYNRIPPMMGIFVPPVDRDNEYAFNQTVQYSQFIVNELMPHLENLYRIRNNPRDRFMTGISYGGLITTDICYHYPEEFGKCAPMSPAYQPRNYLVFDEVLSGPVKNVDFYIDWGTYEPGIMLDGRVLRDSLTTKGYTRVDWNEWHEGHSWGNWRAHIDNALEFLLTDISEVKDEPLTTYFLSQNYPNPFNPRTTIKFYLSRSSEVTLKIYNILGEEVENLLSASLLSGSHSVEWNAAKYASGVYLYRFQAGNYVETRKMVLMR